MAERDQIRLRDQSVEQVALRVRESSDFQLFEFLRTGLNRFGDATSLDGQQ